ncbi:MAG: Penicillin-binding protein, 1A family [Candidatus Magasanikbacteria bacterium GW2011_GWA2_50_22]|nr:MAG: Penicillin-binding protein, 1A family [Candidatus Magasanikbacteria bacterium GW2011_GWA2_50_22]
MFRVIKAVALAIFFLGMLSAGVIVAWGAVISIPSLDNFQNRMVAESTKIFDRTGNVLLYDVHGTMRRTTVPFDSISINIRNATVAIEDTEFYQHLGFRPLSFGRAMLVNIFSGRFVQGGSTITQQVVKNTILTRDKTIIRKLKEIILAIKLERIYSKDQILATYLNETSYGGTIYGVEEASQYFYGIDAKDVTLAQAAYLAALPQAPTRYSPYGSHRDELEARKNLVLLKMKENGFISDAEYQTAKNEKIEFKDEKDAGIKAPHFVFYVREYLEEKYGADAVANDGLRVITTLDYDLQKKAEDVIRTAAPLNEKNFNASNAGLVAIEPKSGQILAMVGSRGYFDKEIDGMVNVTLANRQPGSSFKPFVYATAFEKGYIPDTVVFDLQTQFSTFCEPSDTASSTPPCYSPGNYDEKFRGPMTLREALAQSVNVPSVKTLYLAGITDSLKTASDMGITTLGDKNQYGLTLVLGGGEVNLLEMTGAYGVFANDGVRNPPTPIIKVEDSAGNILESFVEKGGRVIDSQIARLMNDVLSDNTARTPEFGADSPLNFSGFQVADKTGTTNDFHDAWIIGYTPGIAMGAWAGNNDNSPMEKKIAAFIVAPMWHEVLAYALTKYQSAPFVPPAPESELDSLPQVLRGNWNTDPSKGLHDILYWVDKDNPRSGPPANPSGDPQFPHWEYPVQMWATANPQKLTTVKPALPASALLQFSITSPKKGSHVPGFAPLYVSASHSRPETVTRVAYYLNGQFVGSSIDTPYAIAVMPQSHGPASLRAVAESSLGNREQTISFTIQ